MYIDLTPIAYPLNYVLQFGSSIVLGTVLLVTYLWYLTNHHHHRVRRVGSHCMDIHDMAHVEGDYRFDKDLE